MRARKSQSSLDHAAYSPSEQQLLCPCHDSAQSPPCSTQMNENSLASTPALYPSSSTKPLPMFLTEHPYT